MAKLRLSVATQNALVQTYLQFTEDMDGAIRETCAEIEALGLSAKYEAQALQLTQLYAENVRRIADNSRLQEYLTFWQTTSDTDACDTEVEHVWIAGEKWRRRMVDVSDLAAVMAAPDTWLRYKQALEVAEVRDAEMKLNAYLEQLAEGDARLAVLMAKAAAERSKLAARRAAERATAAEAFKKANDEIEKARNAAAEAQKRAEAAEAKLKEAEGRGKRKQKDQAAEA